MTVCNLYRSLYLTDLGYVVYRHCFDEALCTVEAGARAHKVAVFIDGVAAVDYCRYRNARTLSKGSDELPDRGADTSVIGKRESNAALTLVL